VNVAETVMLCRYISANIPHQTLDVLTAEAWQEHLAGVPFGVAQRATAEVIRRKPYVALCDIITVIDRMRLLTRRTVRAEARDRGIAVDIESASDIAITAGNAEFSGVDLLAVETHEETLYARPKANLTGWPQDRKELGA
jgi:hypothetical protein